MTLADSMLDAFHVNSFQWYFVIMDIVEAFPVVTRILKKPNNTDKSLRTD